MTAVAISPNASLVDYLFPARESRTFNLLRALLLVGGFSIFIALCAQISITLPFTPVPITLQTLGVLLTGASLGSPRGGLAVLAYLAEGAAGLPVFAGGSNGFMRLLGPTAGYLWAFPIAAFVTGWLCQRRLDRSFKTSAMAMLPGSLIIYAIGVPWLAFVTHLSIAVAMSKGMVPFLIGDALKLIAAATLLPTTWKTLKLEKPSEKQSRKKDA
jgi:biotin transport system substrate-specific component